MASSFPLFIARRYLFSKKKNNVINIISAISAIGIALATMAMVCVLSGFNGFRDLISSLFTNIDPQLVVVPVQGKYMDADAAPLKALRKDKDVASASNVFQETALILLRGNPLAIQLKGVDDAYPQTTDIQNILYGTGTYEVHRGALEFGIPGIGLAQSLGGLQFGRIQICAPKKGERINISNPLENIGVKDINASGICFQVHQQRYDENMMLCSLAFAQQLYEQQGKITQLEIKLRPDANEEAVQERLQTLLGKHYQVLNRYQQHEETFKIMNIEKIFAFGFLAFILLIACFNIIGSISMLMIDKREDIKTLSNLGASHRLIATIFFVEGQLIIFIGAVVGIILGLLLCLLQQQFGLLRLGGAEGTFIIDAYPISVHLMDILYVLLTIVGIGIISVGYPVYYFSKKQM